MDGGRTSQSRDALLATRSDQAHNRGGGARGLHEGQRRLAPLEDRNE